MTESSAAAFSRARADSACHSVYSASFIASRLANLRTVLSIVSPVQPKLLSPTGMLFQVYRSSPVFDLRPDGAEIPVQSAAEPYREVFVFAGPGVVGFLT
jgi:hypothetical protein